MILLLLFHEIFLMRLATAPEGYAILNYIIIYILYYIHYIYFILFIIHYIYGALITNIFYNKIIVKDKLD